MAIFTSIATAIAGALFGGSALAASLIGGALAFGAKLAIGKLTQQKQQKRKYTAVQGEIQFGGDVPVGTLYGVGKTKGQRTFYAKWGSGNKWNAEVFVLANGWCDGLEPYVYIYGEKKALVSRPLIGNEVANYHIEGFVNGSGDPVLTIRFYDGRPGQMVDQKLVDVTAALGNKWKSTSVNAGICYAVVERIYSDKLFGSKGRPELEFVLRGLREYDPRKDSTVAGGSGPQRLNTPSTWVHTKNPAVHRLNYQLGLRALVSGRTLIGEGKSLGQIDLATYFVAMNVCDTLRANGKRTYECSLFVSGDDDHTEVLKQFDDAMAGYGLNRRGLSGVIPGAPQIPVKDLTAADIPIDRDIGRGQVLDRDLRRTRDDTGEASAVEPIAGHGVVELLQHLGMVIVAADKERALIGPLAVRPQRVADVHRHEVGGEIDLSEALALTDQRPAGDQRAQPQLIIEAVDGRVLRVHPGRRCIEPLRPGAPCNRRVLARIVFAKPAQHEFKFRPSLRAKELVAIDALDDSVADAGIDARALPLVAKGRRDVDQLLIDHLARPAIIEADRQDRVARAVDEALDVIVRNLVTDKRPGYQRFLLAIDVDVGLQAVAPAIREHEDLGIPFVAAAPLRIESPLPLRLAYAVERADRHIAAELDFALDGRVFPLLLLLLGKLADRQLGTEGQSTADKAGGKRRAAEQRASDRSRD
ncbi:hypothetical protein [Sinorhizobium meliloti]|uniref:hypothetical protein n=1 Tax=Rhizobium meliloti TaxID=382 RepID=UPI001F3B7902